MAKTVSKAHDKSRPEVLLTRDIAAPREAVFKVWSSAEHVKRWFAPEHFTVPDAKIEFRSGGVFDLCMRSPSGEDSWMRGRFEEVSPVERLAFTSSVIIGGEKRFTARTTVTFETIKSGAATRLAVHQTYDIHDPNFMAAVEGANEGWRTTLDKLEAEVARTQASQGR
jgi:uncharacterized protein YndB with AHSA1/START domain